MCGFHVDCINVSSSEGALVSNCGYKDAYKQISQLIYIKTFLFMKTLMKLKLGLFIIPFLYI